MEPDIKQILGGCILGFILLGGLFFYQQKQFYDGKLHVVFCNVGQGDAIVIRTPNGNKILIDGGPTDAVLSCMASHMPFWDRTLELMILTHPHADHLNGLLYVIERYNLLSFATENLANKTRGFLKLQNFLKTQPIPHRYVIAQDSFTKKDGVALRIVGPTKAFLAKTSPNGTIGENSEFASVEVLLTFGSFSALFTGDSQAQELQEAISTFSIHNISVLQVPHHGSKTGLSKSILESLHPQVSVISVGKNTYGHPSKETLNFLKDTNTKILRTDQKGDIEIISDGKTWSIN